jgi:futalosine hydrolase
MNILIVAATHIESKLIINNLDLKKDSKNLFSNQELNTDLLVTGIGIPATMYSVLTQLATKKYELLINIGIAGAFLGKAQIGETFNVSSDYFGDIGFYRNDVFTSIFNTKISQNFDEIFDNGIIKNTSQIPEYFNKLQKTNAVTVNIPEKSEIKDVGLESMEGAAFMMIAELKKLNHIQIRSVSNIVGITPRNDWQIETAVGNYSQIITKYFNR